MAARKGMRSIVFSKECNSKPDDAIPRNTRERADNWIVTSCQPDRLPSVLKPGRLVLGVILLTLFLPKNLCCWRCFFKDESRRRIQPARNVHVRQLWSMREKSEWQQDDP